MQRTIVTVVSVLLLLPLLVAGAAHAATLEGKVTSAEDGRLLEGAAVVLEGTSKATVTDSDGTWVLEDVAPGSYTVQVSHVAFWATNREVTLASGERRSLNVELEARIHRSEGVVITKTRAEPGKTPVPHTNVSAQEVRERYYAQDLPVALEGVPSLTTTTDAGHAIGYSYLSLRGFDFKRVSVLLNGIMLNDPEDFYVYWVDLADFGANVEDVQVQRGVGSALLGIPAVGGTIDVQTKTYSDEPSITAEYGYGSYDTKRRSVHLASGPIQGKYYVNARFSRITSDGYRDQSWSDYFSYYLSAARVDENMSTRIVLFGGPIKNHMAYLGITRDQLEQNRTANPLTFPDETDNYYQPHYQLHNTWELSDKATLQQTLYYIRGEGFFDVFYPWTWYYSWGFWDLPQVTTSDSNAYPDAWYRYDSNGSLATNPDGDYYVDLFDAVARQHVNNHQAGYQPRLTLELGRHTIDLGGQFIQHRSRRWGELRWAAVIPNNTDPNHLFYDYQGRKWIFGGYAADEYQMTDRLTLSAALQLAHIRYEVLNDKRFGNSFTQPYTFLMPRAGVSWQLTEPLRLWASYSNISREPRLKDHYWAETGYPVVRYEDPVNFENPTIEPENLHDFELGTEWSSGNLALRLNGYLMRLNNEIVDIGEYDVTGQPIIENASASRRTGIEAGAKYEWGNGFYAEGNLNLAQNRFIDYDSQVPLYNATGDSMVSASIEMDGNTIIRAPERIANVAVGLRKPGYWVRLSAHHVGEQFLANTESFGDVPELPAGTSASDYPTLSQDRSIDAYTRMDLSVGFNLVGDLGSTSLLKRKGMPTVQLELHARNLTDTKYVTNGSADAWGVYVIPAAPRHYFAQVSVTL